MKNLTFHTLDVFTTEPLAGNPLAVVFGGDGLETAQLQALAREFNLSETVFVLPADGPEALAKLRIFTPGAELPFAGHPTVGTAVLLAELGMAPRGDEVRIVLEEAVGAVPVTIRQRPGEIAFAQLTAAAPLSFGPPAPPVDALASALALAPEDIETLTDRPCAASVGSPFLLVPVRTLDALARAKPQPQSFAQLASSEWTRSCYLYCPGQAENTFRARLFAPGLGIIEDPATGSAAAVLCGLLLSRRSADGQFSWCIEQGVEMGRPSRLYLQGERAGGATVAIRVGGHAVRIADGRLLAF